MHDSNFNVLSLFHFEAYVFDVHTAVISTMNDPFSKLKKRSFLVVCFGRSGVIEWIFGLEHMSFVIVYQRVNRFD